MVDILLNVYTIDAFVKAINTKWIKRYSNRATQNTICFSFYWKKENLKKHKKTIEIVLTVLISDDKILITSRKNMTLDLEN